MIDNAIFYMSVFTPVLYQITDNSRHLEASAVDNWPQSYQICLWLVMMEMMDLLWTKKQQLLLSHCAEGAE